MTAFSAAVDAIFADPHLAMDAVLLPERPVRIIRGMPDDVTRFGGGQFVTAGLVFDVRISEAPDLARGDVFKVGTDFFIATASPRADADRLVWSVEVRPE